VPRSRPASPRNGRGRLVRHDCSGARAGNLYLQYWTYYADSATLRGIPIVGAEGFHKDDWESVQIRIRPGGKVDERASSHNGYNYARGAANWGSDAGIDPLKELAEAVGARNPNGWGPETHLLLVSGGFTFFTERLKERLGLDETLSNVLEIDNGKLSGRVLGTIVDADAKAAKFRQMAQRLGAAREQTVAIGDGANDLKMMAEAGTSIAYRAKPVVRLKATYALNYSGLDGVLNLFD